MSKTGKIDWEELKKVGKGALIAGAGALLTYLAEWLRVADFGEYTPLAVAVAAIIVNFARKLSTKN